MTMMVGDHRLARVLHEARLQEADERRRRRAVHKQAKTARRQARAAAQGAEGAQRTKGGERVKGAERAEWPSRRWPPWARRRGRGGPHARWLAWLRPLVSQR